MKLLARSVQSLFSPSLGAVLEREQPRVRLASRFFPAYDSGCTPSTNDAMGFQVEARERDGVVVVDVVGRLTLSDGRTQLRDLVHIFIGKGRRKFLVNLAGVDFIDSDGLGELTRCFSIVRQAGGDLKLVHVQPRVQALLDLTRLNQLFDINSAEEPALRSFRDQR